MFVRKTLLSQSQLLREQPDYFTKLMSDLDSRKSTSSRIFSNSIKLTIFKVKIELPVKAQQRFITMARADWAGTF